MDPNIKNGVAVSKEPVLVVDEEISFKNINDIPLLEGMDENEEKVSSIKSEEERDIKISEFELFTKIHECFIKTGGSNRNFIEK